jgi:hypothetical protein
LRIRSGPALPGRFAFLATTQAKISATPQMTAAGNLLTGDCRRFRESGHKKGEGWQEHPTAFSHGGTAARMPIWSYETTSHPAVIAAHFCRFFAPRMTYIKGPKVFAQGKRT